MKCSKCGAELQKNGKFCAKCGTKIPENYANIKNDIYKKDSVSKNTGKTNFKKVIIGLLIICIAVGGGYIVGNQSSAKGNTSLIAKVKKTVMGGHGSGKAGDKVWCYLDADNELVISQEKITAPKDALVEEMYVDRPSRVVINKDLIHTVRFEGAIKPKSCDSWFFGCTSLKKIKNIENLYMDECVDISAMFDYCPELTSIGNLSKWDTANVTDMSYMFYNCSKLTDIGNLSKWDTANVMDMSGMFADCSELVSIGNLDEWDTANVMDMSSMFSGCSKLSRVGDFSGCSKLTDIGDVGEWDVTKVKVMSSMFSECDKLIVDCSGWTGNLLSIEDITEFSRKTPGVIEPLWPFN